MPYAFRIHEPKRVGDPAPMSASTMSGWTQTSHIAGNLLGNIPIGTSGNKMGTSIPSLFARIFLFEGAFQTLKGANFQRLKEVNTDTKLISECLDLIEFLFQHGNDPKLVIKRWNARNQINNLRADSYPEHTNLASVLEDEIRLYPLLEDIYLFFWKDSTPTNLNPKEFLIGGTSPYTLVFSSPNWLKKVQENGFSFNRMDGSPLFSKESIRSLDQRGDRLKEMLYALRMAYQVELGQQAPCFNEYVTTMWNGESNPATLVNDRASFNSTYRPLLDTNGANVSSGIIPLCYQLIQPDASGYEILPTTNRFANYTARDGSTVIINAPLALNENGLPGVIYIGSSQWNSDLCTINEATIRNTEMHKRVAPGAMGVEYPLLIWSDFLEDKIIKLPYCINSNSFNTAFDGETPYLLPLKRNFFNYFNVEDINKPAYSGSQKKLVDFRIDGRTVTVTINVPIQDPTYRSIEFKKVYKDEDIIDGNFVLGFFPFYRCKEELDRLNRYSIMNCGSGATMNFVNVNQLNSNLDAPSTIRTPQQKLVSQTEYYLINSAFDFVEVTIDGIRGIIIPKMQEITINNQPDNHYNFAVDFGTSNTYIAHTTLSNPLTETLEIDDHDQQTVFLSATTKDLGELNIMIPFINREFAPVQLGRHANISYPARTATCETNNFENNRPNLFGNISIGFNMMHEPQALDIFKYKTGLKWLLDKNPGDIHHTNRVKFYFLQTLWMLKNESLMNGGDDSFDVYITFPETMKNPTKIELQRQWLAAKTKLNINCKFHWGTEYSESVAPYNCMATIIGGTSFLNIDIGGGTSDILFVNKDSGGQISSARYSSAMFAGDDLWGDGVRISSITTQMNNGFVEYIYNQIDQTSQAYPKEIISPLKSLRGGVTSSSADIMGYLFKHDNEFGTSSKIMGQRNLYSLIFIHYAALMYNVSRLIKKMEIDIPLNLSFTGMGSKYINIISTDPEMIKKLTVLLLQKYTGKTIDPAFKIITDHHADVKEITAKGVLEGLNLYENYKITMDKLGPIVDYGFDSSSDITYADVRTDSVRNKVLSNFASFVDSLRDRDFANFLFRNFNLTISGELLDDLKKLSKQSFVTMSANISTSYDELNVTETLFFWPLKNSLVEISKNYAKYK